jgi:hypothetical protein
MSGFFKRLRRTERLGDLATDDWAPVPVSSTARPNDVVGWLESAEHGPAPEARPRGPKYLQHLSSEELAIISDQRRQNELQNAPRPQPMATEAPPRREASAPHKVKPPSQRSKWIDVLTQYAEHLSDAELSIIRRQLASSSA